MSSAVAGQRGHGRGSDGEEVLFDANHRPGLDSSLCNQSSDNPRQVFSSFAYESAHDAHTRALCEDCAASSS